ncbi:MAG: DedA family protein [Deltaproteobacteria bacterium]|nr:DedA family protein [Deltaproteobacteria bacterium]
MMDLVRKCFDIFLHLDRYLRDWTSLMGGWLYALLFLVVFCETGLVVTPFLPGDSLLFAVGAIAALDGSPLNVAACIVVVSLAAVLGDAANYSIGYRIGPKVFFSESSRWLSKKHLLRAQAFYEKYGGKTIFLARFVPIIRTFAPFVAGIGKMRYRRFAMFNVTGGITWVAAFILAGYFFGNLPQVKRNFQYVIMAIIVISVMPMAIEYVRERRAQARQAAAGGPSAAPEG